MAAIHPALASRHGDVSGSSHKRPPVTQRAPTPNVAPSSDISAGFPAIDIGGDLDNRVNASHGAVGGDSDNPEPYLVDKLLQKVPQSIWQPNAVVQRHRRKAPLYWLLLLLGYGVYIGLVSESAFLAVKCTESKSSRTAG